MSLTGLLPGLVEDKPTNMTTGAQLSDRYQDVLGDQIQINLTKGGTYQTYNEEYNVMDQKWSALKQPLYAVILLAVAYIVVAFLGIINNTLVITVIYRQAKMRTVTNYFLANLATADVLVCIIVLPITLLENVYTEWWYGGVLCKIAPYLQGVSVSASVNTLAAVAVERYLATFAPTTRKMTPHTAIIVIGVIWIIPLAVFTPWIVVYRETVYRVGGFDYVACNADWTSPILLKTFTLVVVFLTCYLIPLVFIAIFYLLIGIKVFRRRVEGLSGSTAERSISRSKTKILRMLVVVVVLFSLSWLPLYSISFRVMFGPAMTTEEKYLLKRYLTPLAQWLGASNSCVNPFVYCYFSCSFRRGITDVINRSRRRSALESNL